MRLIPPILILATMLAGCASAPPATTTTPPPDGDVAILRAADCSPSYDPDDSGEARLVLRSEAAWKAAWDERCAEGVSPYREPPRVEFGSEMVLLYAWGEKPSGGHSAAIEGVEVVNGTLVVHVHRVAPAWECPAPAIVMYPTAIAVVAHLPEIPVEWMFRDETRTCGP